MATISIDQTKSRAILVDYVGDDIVIPIRYPAKGELFDMTGSSARLYLRDKPSSDDEDIVLEMVIGDGIAFVDAKSHNIEVTISKAQTVELGVGRFYGYFLIDDSLDQTDTKFEILLRLVGR